MFDLFFIKKPLYPMIRAIDSALIFAQQKSVIGQDYNVIVMSLVSGRG